jgi:hypothetical protein
MVGTDCLFWLWSFRISVWHQKSGHTCSDPSAIYKHCRADHLPARLMATGKFSTHFSGLESYWPSQAVCSYLLKETSLTIQSAWLLTIFFWAFHTATPTDTYLLIPNLTVVDNRSRSADAALQIAQQIFGRFDFHAIRFASLQFHIPFS